MARSVKAACCGVRLSPPPLQTQIQTAPEPTVAGRSIKQCAIGYGKFFVHVSSLAHDPHCYTVFHKCTSLPMLLANLTKVEYMTLLCDLG